MLSLSSLPEEVQVDIFLRLPLNTILACRCVSKSWCGLLCSYEFVKNHLNHAIQRNYRHMLSLSPNKTICSITYASILSPASSKPSYGVVCDEAVHIDYPFWNKNIMSIVTVGSCNGLICLGISSGGMGIDEKSCICIWNPSTGKYKNIKIPPYDFHSRLSNLVRYGFGYDSHKDDYKLVRISDNEDPGCFNIQVHMLASKSWKTIQRTDCYAFPRLSGVLVNGALHWLGVTTQGAPSEVIVSFNINYDRLMDISFPGETMPSLEGNRVLYKDVGVLGDCLCIVFAVLGIRTDVWVMQDYGIRESWIKRFTTTTSSENIERSPLMVRYWECSISKRMWSLESGEILVDEHQDLILYDQSYKTSRYLTSYVESLVSIKSRMHVKKRNTNGDNKKKPKQQRLR